MPKVRRPPTTDGGRDGGGSKRADTCPTVARNVGELVTERRPFLCDEINVKAPTDTETCDIAGMVIIGDGRLVLTDNNNESVKLFDRNHVLTSRVRLQSGSGAIAEVRSGEVVVCNPMDKNIQFLSVADTLTPGRVIETAVECYSVAPCGDGLVACICSWQGKMVILDMRGRKVKTVWKYQYHFGCHVYARLHPDNDHLYVLHYNGVTCVSLDGKVVCEYRNDTLKWPRGLFIHPDGSVYVCGESHNIHHITSQCTKIEVLCGGQVVEPQSICYNHVDNTLYVAEEDKDIIKVFKMPD